jgi:hypothetical protein
MNGAPDGSVVSGLLTILEYIPTALGTSRPPYT